MSRPVKSHWLISCCFVLLAGLLFGATLDPGPASSPAFHAVSQALFVTLACYLLLPATSTFEAVLLNSAGAAVLFMLCSRIPVMTAVPPGVSLRLCVVVFCLGMLLWSLTQLFESLFPRSRSIAINITLLTTVITSAPLWMGPLADVYQAGDAIVDGAVSITPLTHFSVAAGYDYLRSEWMYRNSAFGSLPFAYPGLTGITFCYLLFVLILQILRRKITQHAQNPGSR